MTKPIVVIYLPDNFSLGVNGENAPMELMSILNNFDTHKYKSNDYWKDYYWFCWTKRDIGAPEFQVFYEKDFTEIQFQELKQLIENELNELKNKSL